MSINTTFLVSFYNFLEDFTQFNAIKGVNFVSASVAYTPKEISNAYI